MSVKINHGIWDGIAMSGIRVVMEKVREMKARGREVYGFTAGEPDFETPAAIKEETIRALRANHTHYTSNRGDLSLREAISRRHVRKTGVLYDAQTEILITTGAAEAINNAFAASVKAGSEVIIFSPAFMNYENMVKALGAIPVKIPLTSENGFQICMEDVRRSVTDRTTHIVINNPCNPTGAVYSKETLEALCRFAREKDITIISDEIYSELTYDGKKFYSISQFAGMKEQCIIISGFSKEYAMTGWRLGYVLAPRCAMDVILKVHQYSSTSGVTFIQEGTAAGMENEGTSQAVRAMKEEFAVRRDLICRLLDDIPELSYVKPSGAFYIMVDVSGTGLTGKEFAERLLEEKNCAVIPAVVLGEECVNFIRLSFAVSQDMIQKGMTLVKEFVEEERRRTRTDDEKSDYVQRKG